jgi:hypothetical protein
MKKIFIIIIVIIIILLLIGFILYLFNKKKNSSANLLILTQETIDFNSLNGQDPFSTKFFIDFGIINNDGTFKDVSLSQYNRLYKLQLAHTKNNEEYKNYTEKKTNPFFPLLLAVFVANMINIYLYYTIETPEYTSHIKTLSESFSDAIPTSYIEPFINPFIKVVNGLIYYNTMRSLTTYSAKETGLSALALTLSLSTFAVDPSPLGVALINPQPDPNIPQIIKNVITLNGLLPDLPGGINMRQLADNINSIFYSANEQMRIINSIKNNNKALCEIEKMIDEQDCEWIRCIGDTKWNPMFTGETEVINGVNMPIREFIINLLNSGAIYSLIYGNFAWAGGQTLYAFIKTIYSTNLTIAEIFISPILLIMNYTISFFQEYALFDINKNIDGSWIDPYLSVFIRKSINTLVGEPIGNTFIYYLQTFANDLLYFIKELFRLYYNTLIIQYEAQNSGIFININDVRYDELRCGTNTFNLYLFDGDDTKRVKLILPGNMINCNNIVEFRRNFDMLRYFVKRPFKEKIDFMEAYNKKQGYPRNFLLNLKKMAGITLLSNEEFYMSDHDVINYLENTIRCPGYILMAMPVSSITEVLFENPTPIIYNINGGYPFGTQHMSYQDAYNYRRISRNREPIGDDKSINPPPVSDISKFDTYSSPDIRTYENSVNMRLACSDFTIKEDQYFYSTMFPESTGGLVTCFGGGDAPFMRTTMLPNKTPGSLNHPTPDSRQLYCYNNEIDEAYPLYKLGDPNIPNTPLCKTDFNEGIGFNISKMFNNEVFLGNYYVGDVFLQDECIIILSPFNPIIPTNNDPIIDYISINFKITNKSNNFFNISTINATYTYALDSNNVGFIVTCNLYTGNKFIEKYLIVGYIYQNYCKTIFAKYSDNPPPQIPTLYQIADNIYFSCPRVKNQTFPNPSTVYVAVGSRISLSLNFAPFRNIIPPTYMNLIRDIIYFPSQNIFVAVCDAKYRYFSIFSRNGENWYIMDTNGHPTENTAIKVGYSICEARYNNNPIVVACGDIGDGGKNQSFSTISYNGIQWSNAVTGNTILSTARGVCFRASDNKFVAVGQGPGINIGGRNRTSWACITTGDPSARWPTVGTRGILNAGYGICLFGETFYAVGPPENINVIDSRIPCWISWSPDGIDWRNLYRTMNDTREISNLYTYAKSIATNNRVLVTVGGGSTNSLITIYPHLDNRFIDYKVFGKIYFDIGIKVIWNGYKFIATGYFGINPNVTVIITSLDGETWTKQDQTINQRIESICSITSSIPMRGEFKQVIQLHSASGNFPAGSLMAIRPDGTLATMSSYSSTYTIYPGRWIQILQLLDGRILALGNPTTSSNLLWLLNTPSSTPILANNTQDRVRFAMQLTRPTSTQPEGTIITTTILANGNDSTYLTLWDIGGDNNLINRRNTVNLGNFRKIIQINDTRLLAIAAVDTNMSNQNRADTWIYHISSNFTISTQQVKPQNELLPISDIIALNDGTLLLSSFDNRRANDYQIIFRNGQYQAIAFLNIDTRPGNEYSNNIVDVNGFCQLQSGVLLTCIANISRNNNRLTVNGWTYPLSVRPTPRSSPIP